MSVAISLASRADDAGVRRLVRTQAMPGRVRLSFCREPDFSTGCAVTGDDYRILVARSQSDGDVVGVACRSVRRVFLNGREQRIGYLGQLRVDPRYRGRWLVSRGFAMLEAMHRIDPLPAYLVSIVDGNEEATGILVRKPRRGFPRFREVASYVTFALRVRRSRWRRAEAPRTREHEAPAHSPHVDEVADFLQREGPRRQLSSVWTADSLHRLAAYGLTTEDMRVVRGPDGIAGVIALWDQSAYKQSVIRGYSGWLRIATPLLPQAGTCLKSAYASLVCVAHGDVGVFDALLREVCVLAAERGFDYLLVGLDMRDPFADLARTYPHIAYPSRLYLASWPQGDLPHDSLDDRPVYVDIATL